MCLVRTVLLYLNVHVLKVFYELNTWNGMDRPGLIGKLACGIKIMVAYNIATVTLFAVSDRIPGRQNCRYLQ